MTQHTAVSSQQYIHDLGLMPSQRSPGGLSTGLPVHETMRLPPLGYNWAQSPNQVLDTADNIVVCMAAKRKTKRKTGEDWNPPGTSGGQQSRRNCKSRAQRALESPGTVDSTGGRVESHLGAKCTSNGYNK